MNRKLKRYKKCIPFTHKWSRSSYIAYAYGSLKVKVCYKCTEVETRGHIFTPIGSINPNKIKAVQDEILGIGWEWEDEE